MYYVGMNETPEYLTAKEFAALFRISTAQVYQLISEGQIRAIRIGGSLRISQREIDRLDPTRLSNESEPEDCLRSAPPQRLISL